MKTIKNPNKSEWSKILERPVHSTEDIEITVRQVFEDIKRKGDSAVLKYTSQFDNTELASNIVSDTEIKEAIFKVSDELKTAINIAKINIEKFHEEPQSKKTEIETTSGVICWQEKRAIEKVGLYIPGGTAPLFSSVLMLGVPALIAGCKEVVLCSPPDRNGQINPAILYTAHLCGIDKIYKVGGIQAIASLTFGTETIPNVYKIFGPGNQFVTIAKQFAINYGVAIDMPAGPSELLIVADDTAIPAFVASDLLSQAEHGVDSQVILVSPSLKLIDAAKKEINIQIKSLPRKSIAQKAISNSKFIYIPNEVIALELINEYGPEHLIICSADEDYYVNGIVNAGSVFLGNFSPESAGDYASGTNHTLPTNGFSKAYSGINLDSFKKSMTFQRLSKEGIQNIGNTIEIMAEAEGLQAHKNAVSLRLKHINQ